MLLQRKIFWKLLLLLLAFTIAGISLWYTSQLVNKLAREEEKKVKLWIRAIQLITEADADQDVSYLLDIIRENETIPIIQTDENGQIIYFANIDTALVNQNPNYLQQQLLEMKGENPPIIYEYLQDRKNVWYYKNSILLTQLKYYPVYQIIIVSLFLLLSYLAFNAARRSEQNRVWVGLAKETAHQLGTPISSLLAWLDLFKSLNFKPEPYMLDEMAKDIDRLQLVSERFSKIGSTPILEDSDLIKVIEKSVNYMRTRTSKKVEFSILASPLHNCFAQINRQLFDWVLENLCKNAIDAMEGQGKITFEITENKKLVFIDVIDTGKGIPTNQHSAVFKPGFTTKKRGWGLGLSLAKRIIEDYHKGEIVVRESIPGKGTTFRITLRKRKINRFIS